MTQRFQYTYDVFISYNPTDREWVDEWLLPRLDEAGIRVISDDDFVGGAPKLTEIERAIDSSLRTLAIITPGWIEDEWRNFDAMLVRAKDPAARRRKLIPVLLEPAQLPDSIDALVKRDLTRETQWEKQVNRLVRDICDVIPVVPPWETDRGIRDLSQWKKWLWRYRRELRRRATVVFLVWLTVSLLLQLPPFQQRFGWQALGLKVKGVERLTRAGSVLLASTTTDFIGCNVADTGDTGLWKSTTQGREWDYVVVPELAFNRPGQGCVLAAITAFAYVPALPRRIYASTSDVGLLRSDDAGQTWTRVGEDSLPDKHLRTVAVGPREPYDVWVATEKAGLYRWSASENSWKRVDGATTCVAKASDETSLPPDLSVGAILATTNTVYIGTDEGLDQPGSASGIYRSRDGGNCWQRIHDAQERYSYLAITEIPNGADELVILSVDHNTVSGRANHQLWVLEGDQRRTPDLWESGHAANRLYVDPGPPSMWYVISNLGEVFRGHVVGGRESQLPTITACYLPPTCLTDLTSDFQPGPPLILANDQIYRRAQVSWWRWLWP